MGTYLAINDILEQRPLIPVCCICNRQRTSADTWEPFDIEESSDDFYLTHGYCPDCIRKHYPKAVSKLEALPA